MNRGAPHTGREVANDTWDDDDVLEDVARLYKRPCVRASSTAASGIDDDEVLEDSPPREGGGGGGGNCSEDEEVLEDSRPGGGNCSDDDVMEDTARAESDVGEFDDGLDDAPNAPASAPVPSAPAAAPQQAAAAPKRLFIIRRPSAPPAGQPEIKQRKRGAARTEAQAAVIEHATKPLNVETFLRETPLTPDQMLSTALSLRRGVEVPYGAVFGPRPKLDTQSIGHVPRTDTFLLNHIGHVLRLLSMRTRKAPSVPPMREAPRRITGHDMQRHYLVAAVRRPSPLDPSIILDPRPCAMGTQCAAMRHYEPMLLNYTKPSFALVGALEEDDMRQFYRTGRWPAGKDHMCVVCHIMLTQRSAIVVGNLCPSARPVNVQFQSVCNDDDIVDGFKRIALDEPGTETSVVEFPMMRLCAPGAVIGRWRPNSDPSLNLPEVPYVDISASLNNPVGFNNSAAWSSDRKN